MCRDLDLTESAVRRWVEQADVDAGRQALGGMVCHRPTLRLRVLPLMTGECYDGSRFKSFEFRNPE
jgi:hypothetical protein